MKYIYFIGICGISMSSLAVMAKRDGFFVQGYDANKNCALLKQENISVTDELEFDEIKKADMIVYSSAFNENFPLISYAKSLHKKCLVRGEFLAWQAQKFENVIAVAGAHGKSTVAAMIYTILDVAGQNPSLHLGAFLKKEKSNFVLNGTKFFVTEACEYHDNFLFLKPKISVITNIQKEHLDYFKNFENLKKSFYKFKNNSEFCIDKTHLKAGKAYFDRFGRLCFSVFKNKRKIFDLSLKVSGIYNKNDALFAIEVCQKIGVPLCFIKLGLESFEGIEKRFEKVFCKSKCFLDYAHHPKEIDAVLHTCELIQGKKVAVFQPHTYSRTRNFLNDFVDALSKFDEVILYKTFPAREKEDRNVEKKLFLEILKKKKCCLFYDLNLLIKKLNSFAREDNLLIMGAGDLPERLQSSQFICRDLKI